jgi:glutamyl-tRNA synthetase
VRTALFNWLFARKHGGAFIARLEDTDRDPERYKPESIQDIERSLEGLGAVPDEWWKNGDPAGYVQSERLEHYQDAAARLIESGAAYRCFCTSERLAEMRAEQQSRGVPTGYDRRCRRLSREDSEKYVAQGLPFTVRMAVPLEGKTTYEDQVYGQITFENKLIDDQVLLKSSGWPTYHLAVVVDDHAMGITHVIRGEDWQPSTPKQVLLYQALGWEMPVWVHAPLIVGPDRKKLSKRHGSTKMADFLDEGYLPEALFNFLVLLGWSPGEENREIFSKEEILERFSLEGISKSAAVFDYDKLRWMNGEYIRALPVEELLERVLPYLQKASLVSTTPRPEDREYLAKVLPLVVERMKLLSEIPGLVDFFYWEPQEVEEKGRKKWLSGSDARHRLAKCIEVLSASEGDLTLENVEEATNRIADELAVQRGPIIHTLRAATTGRTVGPGLFELMTVLGRDRVLQRLDRARDWVSLTE